MPENDNIHLALKMPLEPIQSQPRAMQLGNIFFLQTSMPFVWLSSEWLILRDGW